MKPMPWDQVVGIAVDVVVDIVGIAVVDVVGIVGIVGAVGAVGAVGDVVVVDSVHKVVEDCDCIY
jgi:hypothetical protein